MSMKKLLLTWLLGGLLVRPFFADEPKYHDKDLIYEETRVPAYDLPPLLVSSEGKPITTTEEWFNIRRPQIMSLFGNLIYGVVPEAASPIKVTSDIVKTDRQFMNGLATRKNVRIRFENEKGKAEILILVFSPNRAGKPIPAFLQLSFSDTRDDGHDADPGRQGYLRNGIPLTEFLQRGFGFVVVYQGLVITHILLPFR
jgi:hypothetical protein